MAQPAWPSIEQQLREAEVRPDSALERLIQENQDFDLLRPEEATDNLGLPLWLRVYWRKQHPELESRPYDPTGGYPRFLKNVYAWMLTHQDLQPDPPPDTPYGSLSGPDTSSAVDVALSGGGGVNLRISGAQTTRRSESDIRVNYNNPSQIIAAANAPSRQAQFYLSDGGAGWDQTTLPLVPGDVDTADPAVDWTSDGTAWATMLGIDALTKSRVRAFQSPDAGQTWSFDSIVSGSQTATDKPMVWVDHSPTSPFKDNIYVIWHKSGPVFVNRRTGLAGAWQTPIQVSGAETTGTGIGGDIKTNSFGDVFAFWPDTGSRRLLVAKSTNGGVSFGAPVRIATTFDAFDIGVPSFNSRRALIYISGGACRTATKDLVYAIWTDLTGTSSCDSSGGEPGANVSSNCKTRIWISRSTNGGTTWEAPRMINNQKSRNDQFNPRMAVDETNGQLVVIYYDTVGDPVRTKTDVWHQTSSDDGVHWSIPIKVTTAQTDETTGGADLPNQYGDYNGLTSNAGVAFPSWTDRRSGGPEEIWTAAISLPHLFITSLHPLVVEGTIVVRFQQAHIGGLGETTDQTLTITNKGPGDATVTFPPPPAPNTSPFNWPNIDTFVLAPSSSRNVHLTFHPRGLGPFRHPLTVTSNTPDGSYSIELRGRGVPGLPP